jgi:hypothetical protein
MRCPFLPELGKIGFQLRPLESEEQAPASREEPRGRWMLLSCAGLLVGLDGRFRIPRKWPGVGKSSLFRRLEWIDDISVYVNHNLAKLMEGCKLSL